MIEYSLNDEKQNEFDCDLQKEGNKFTFGILIDRVNGQIGFTDKHNNMLGQMIQHQSFTENTLRIFSRIETNGGKVKYLTKEEAIAQLLFTAEETETGTEDENDNERLRKDINALITDKKKL